MSVVFGVLISILLHANPYPPAYSHRNSFPHFYLAHSNLTYYCFIIYRWFNNASNRHAI